MDGRIIISTYPDRKSAEEMARTAVGSRLAACVNLVKLDSLYVWKEKLEEAEEYLAIFKTTSDAVDQLKTDIQARHPYEVPEIIEIQPRDINQRYLDWLKDSTATPHPE